MDTQEIINNMIDKIIDGDLNNAHDDFLQALSSKVGVALDDAKQQLAQSIYSNEVEQEETDTEEVADEPSTNA